MDRRLLTFNEVAQYLNLKRSTIYSLMGDPIKPLPSLKIGHSRRFDIKDLEEYINDYKTTKWKI